MLGVPVAELFPSVFAAARTELRRRARRMLKQLAKQPLVARNLRRKQSLEAVLMDR
jgi:hypothetical protein